MNIYVITLLFNLANACISPIEYIEPPICNDNNIGTIGLKKAYEYGKLFFGNIDNHLSKKQSDCILKRPLKINQDIKICTEQLTINNNTIPLKVAKGLALNNNNEWVSACVEGMPCIQFNNFVYNKSFTKLLEHCDALEPFKKLFNNTHFIESSWYGMKYCQYLYPKKCLYLERETCSNKDYLYACPVSRWVYASNFMLFYILDPKIAARMPGCRIIY